MKILTWNILGGADYKREIEYVSKIEADVFCLQEVQVNYPGYYDGQDVDVLTAFREAFPNYHSAFAPINHRVYEGRDQAFGNAIFSRFHIASEEAIYFHKAADWSPTQHQNQARNLLVCRVDINGKQISVATCHLTYEPYFKDTQRQIDEAEKIVAALANDRYAIVLGDFNSVPESEVVMTLKKRFVSVPKQEDFTFARIPWGYNGFNVGTLQYKLDHILHSDNIASVNLPLPDTDLSDHLPLAATIDFK